MISLAKPSNRILIVDNDPLVRQTLWDLLTDQGFCPISVTNGSAAIKACATESIDLTLLDFALDPTMHGIDTLKTLRRDHPAIKVIIITGCPHPVLIGMAHQLDARQCLIKPIDPTILLHAIQREFATSYQH
jgi:DNA-binding NtrC family response regulator